MRPRTRSQGAVVQTRSSSTQKYRKVKVNYAEQDAKLDELLGLNKPLEANDKKVNIKLFRRKVERSCPAIDLFPSSKPAAATQVARQQGFRKPILYRATAGGTVCDTRKALGLVLPPLDVLTPRGLVKAIGLEHSVPTVDVTNQSSGPHMSVKELTKYFEAPPERRTRLLNVVSFSLTETPLADMITPPKLVQDLDLVSKVWSDEESSSPETLLYLLLGPQGAYTDWHVDMGGSAVWYHVVRGSKVFLLAPPTPHNQTSFEGWSTSLRQKTCFLGDELECVTRVALKAGDTLFIPSGWPHAVSTPLDSIVVGGNFLHSMDLGAVADVYRQELRLGVTLMFQFPYFQKVMWYCAKHALEGLQNGKMLTSYELSGLQHLIELLKDCISAGKGNKDVPECIENPRKLLVILEALLKGAQSSVETAWAESSDRPAEVESEHLAFADTPEKWENNVTRLSSRKRKVDVFEDESDTNGGGKTDVLVEARPVHQKSTINRKLRNIKRPFSSIRSDLSKLQIMEEIWSMESILEEQEEMLRRFEQGKLHLEDQGVQLRVCIAEIKRKVELKWNVATGRVLLVLRRIGRNLKAEPFGPYAPSELAHFVEIGHYSPEIDAIQHILDGQFLTLEQALSVREPPYAALLRATAAKGGDALLQAV